ncbi:MAG: FecR domain-containing protein [Polyangiaceae bacterium]
MSIESHLREPELSSEDRESLWSGVHLKRRARRRRRRLLRTAIFAGSLFVAGVGVQQHQARMSRTELAAPTRLKLPDGSSVVSQPGTDLEVVEGGVQRVRVDLRAGSAGFQVVPNPARRFSVMLPRHEIRVVGTRFQLRVDARADLSELDVEEGTVEVRRRDTQALLARVHAGEHWSSDAPAPETSAAPEPPAPPSSTSSSRASSTEGTARAASPGPPNPSAPSEESQAAALFDQATVARRHGDFKSAIAGYENLLKCFPKDRHASLAALELGRLKRVREADPKGAADALERAAEDRELNDDALAQLVLSYDQAGDRKRCLAAQSRYLSRHPEGVHVNEVRASCKGTKATPR